MGFNLYGEPVAIDPVDLVGYWKSAPDGNLLEVHLHANGALRVATREGGRRLGDRFEDEGVFVSDRDLILRNESGPIEDYQRVRKRR